MSLSKRSRPRRPMPSGAEAIREERRARQARQAASAGPPPSPANPAPAPAALTGAAPPAPARPHAGPAARRPRSPGAPTPAPGPGPAPGGQAVIRSAWIGTVVFLIATAAAAFVPTARIPAVAVDLALLLGGSGLYFWGWAVAAGRSRDDEISLWNLILLEDVAPSHVRVQLLGALTLQVIVAAATCWITAALAFGWLVPVWGLAHCEFWGARYGVFPSRQPAAADRPRRPPSTRRS